MPGISKKEFEALVAKVDEANVPESDLKKAFDTMLHFPSYVLFDDGSVHKVTDSSENMVLATLQGNGGMSTKIATFKLDKYTISTVFLSMDHGYGFGQTDMPILFETALFEGYGFDGFSKTRGIVIGSATLLMYRYPTYEIAMGGHEALVKKLQELSEARPADLVHADNVYRGIAQHFYNNPVNGRRS